LRTLTVSFLLIYTVLFVTRFFLKKKIYINFALINSFTFLNFALYLLKWSALASEPSDEVYLIILNLAVLCIVSMFVEKPQKVTYLISVRNLRMGGLRINILDAMNVIVLFMIFAESYILSDGHFFPYLANIDIHVASLGTLSAILRSLDIFVFLLNYMQYYATNKRVYILFDILLVVVNLFTNGSRFLVAIMVGSLFVEYLLYNPLGRKRKILTFIFIGFILIAVFSIFGILRLNNYSLQGNISYARLILYTGPFSQTSFIGEVFSTYYGYFPLSFNNLTLSIEKFKSENFEHYYGQILLSPISVGIFKISKLLNINYMQMVHNATDITHTAATVPTGLFSVYMDFGEMNIIGLTIYFIISLLFATHIHLSPFFLINYASFLIFWFIYANFLDYFATSVPLYLLIISFIFFQYFATAEEIHTGSLEKTTA